MTDPWRKSTISDMFEEAPAQDMRDCGDKDLCHAFDGRILCCKHNTKTTDIEKSRISTPQLNNLVLDACNKNNTMSIGEETESNNSNVTFPPCRYRRDIMTYCNPIDNLDPDASDFYFNEIIRHHTSVKLKTSLLYIHPTK